jgi:hypothetical protein
MAANDNKSTLQSILENLRDAAVRFTEPFKTPGKVPTALKDLLAKLGIANPANSVSTSLQTVAESWGDIGRQLENTTLDIIAPAQMVKLITDKADAIRENIDRILNVPEGVWNRLGASGAAIKVVFPKRLMDYIIYEALTQSHAKIGGVFLLFAVLRKEFTPAGGNPAFVDAEIRIFDLAQLIEVISNPRQAMLKALKWGTDDFNARPLADGLVLLMGLLPGTTKGPEDDLFAIADEQGFVPVTPGVKQSARRTLTSPAAAGSITVSFVGLHRHGFGLLAPNPLNANLNFGPWGLPKIPPDFIFALTPPDPPGIKLLRLP